MEYNTLQLGATFIIAMSLIKLVEFVISKYANGNNGKNKEENLLIEIKQVLIDIREIQKDRFQNNDRYHEKIDEKATKIMSKLKIS